LDEDYSIRPIGVIHTPFEKDDRPPIQATGSDIQGEAEVFPEYVPALDSLDGFSHIILLYWFHDIRPVQLRVTPYLDTQSHGLFATRAPSRPNPIGLSVVEIVSIADGRIVFKGADMLDGSPLLDIKPFVPRFDHRPHATSGWLTDKLSNPSRLPDGDDRFSRDL
jgi:tRNA-Thr(GGU) m(6)t(6)A37 methyltransferase TsaA